MLAVLTLLISARTLLAEPLPFELPFAKSHYSKGPLVLHSNAAVDVSGYEVNAGVMFWDIKGDRLSIGVAATGYYVGFGINDKGPRMAGADLALCREFQAGSGKISVADYYAYEDGVPTLDPVQDWVLVRSGRTVWTPPSVPAGACPSGYTWKFNKCYRASKTGKNFDQARQECQSEGGDLAHPTNAVENKFIAELVMALQTSSDKQKHKPWAWIGGEQSGSQCLTSGPRNDMHWVDDNSKLSQGYENWRENTHWNKRCQCYQQWCKQCTLVGMLGLEHTQGKTDLTWYDHICIDPSVRYVCQRPVNPGTKSLPSSAFEPKLPITWCEIERTLDTCEHDKDVQLSDKLEITLNALLAWSDFSAKDDSMAYHGYYNRKATRFSFLESVKKKVIPDNAVTMEIKAQSAHVVSQAQGSYACTYHVLPLPDSANTRYHVVSFHSFANLKSPSFVNGLQHHVNLNVCTQPLTGVADGASIDCGATMQYCNQVWLTAGPKTFASDEGIPIGKGATRWVVMSRHFYNPTQKAGVPDYGTGYRVIYTPTLRPKEIGQILIGTSSIHVPAKSYMHRVRAECGPTCAKRIGHITVTEVFLHMHGHGRKGVVRLVRDGKELRPIATIDPWDQSLATRAVNRKVLPTDLIILDCYYDNDLDKPLKYGDAINDEMCYAFLTVAGQAGVSECTDYPSGNGQAHDSGTTSYCNSKKNQWASNPSLMFCNINAAANHCPVHDARQDPNNCAARSGSACAPPYCWKPKGYCEPLPYVMDASRYPSKPTSFAAYKASEQFNCKANSKTGTVVPAMPGSCPANKVIVGSADCGRMGGSDFKVQWSTDCSARVVTFTVQTNNWGSAWMAIGFHDAGTAAKAKAMPSNAMANLEIVQVSAFSSGAKIREGVSSTFSAPTPKQQPLTKLVEAKVSNGKHTVRFERPFQSNGSGGLTFAPDRFVWLVCAMRHGSPGFDAKHSMAFAQRKARISFFGGIPESVRPGVVSTMSATTPKQPTSAQTTALAGGATTPKQPTSAQTTALAGGATMPKQSTSAQATTPAGGPDSCNAPANKRIVGTADCGSTWDSKFKVGWATDCVRRVVTFTVEASAGGNAWMAIGLHDAGTSSSSKSVPLNGMNGLDIVQFSANTKRIREGVGSGYSAPAPRQKPLNKLLEAQVSNGKHTVRFERPFQSNGGGALTLDPDGFVWLACAILPGSTDLDSMHNTAFVNRNTRISFFSGTVQAASSTDVTPLSAISRRAQIDLSVFLTLVLLLLSNIA